MVLNKVHKTLTCLFDHILCNFFFHYLPQLFLCNLSIRPKSKTSLLCNPWRDEREVKERAVSLSMKKYDITVLLERERKTAGAHDGSPVSCWGHTNAAFQCQIRQAMSEQIKCDAHNLYAHTVTQILKALGHKNTFIHNSGQFKLLKGHKSPKSHGWLKSGFGPKCSNKNIFMHFFFLIKNCAFSYSHSMRCREYALWTTCMYVNSATCNSKVRQIRRVPL